MIPEARIDEFDNVLVLRDDIVQGGTKRRVLAELLDSHLEFVYASPASGYAQIALAYACRDAGKKATIFVARRNELHKRTAEAKSAGAKIVQVPHGYLTNVQAKAKAYAEMVGARLMPFGFDCDEFIDRLASFAKSLPIAPLEVWSVAGSGTLTRALQRAWPQASFNAVQIGREPKIGAARKLKAPEKFDDDATVPPPFPSCSNYDAKAWFFIKRYATEGALFWNVAA
jgi:hypothetical protein